MSLPLSGGGVFHVCPSDIPWIAEHEWRREPETALIVRRERGRTIHLNHLLAKRYAGKPGAYLILPDAAIRTVFGGLDPFDELSSISALLQEIGDGYGYTLPSPERTIRAVLSIALDAFYQARSRHRCYPDGTPFPIPHGYLGEWFAREPTGRDLVAPNSPTLAMPEFYRHAISRRAMRAMESWLRRENPEVYLPDLCDALTVFGVITPANLIRSAMNTVACYRCPEE